MSSQTGTSRAGRTKDKNAKSTVISAASVQDSPHIKTEKAAPKPTVEQIRMAQMIDPGKDSANAEKLKQLVEMTGRSVDDVALALHDAQDDADRAVMILLEGGEIQGEWETQDKKKKRTSNVKTADKELAAIPVQENDRGDTRPERYNDHDRQENVPPRHGRNHRNGGPPPRLANRGRGRERNNYRGDRDRDRSGFSGDRERGGGFSDNTGTSTVNGGEDWEAEISAGTTGSEKEQGQSEPHRGERFGEERNRGGFGDRNRGGFDKDGGYVERRGFGNERGRGRGRGGFGRPNSRGGRPRRFERQNESSEGPHIDTWTNETAENAEKENNSWADQIDSEDWGDDQWTGSLEETKVFTPSQSKAVGETELSTSLTDSGSILGQRINPEDLFSASREMTKSSSFPPKTSSGSFYSDYNQQVAESIKSQIGIGSSARQNLSNMPASQPQTLGQLSAMSQRDLGQSAHSSMLPPSSNILPSSSASPSLSSSPTIVQQAQQQRRPQRSKLPPPSKIPSSAVEMPGHTMPQLDVQFGVDFGSESNHYSFGGSTENTNSSYTNSSPGSNSGHISHMGPAVETESKRQASILASPSAGGQSLNTVAAVESSPSRPVYSTVYTTPTKSSTVSSKVVEPIPFSSPVSDHKSGSLITTQRTNQTPSVMPQGSISTNKPDSSTIPNFSAANGFTTTSYAHKSNSSQSNFPHAPAVSSSAPSYPGQFSSQAQYSSQTPQNQYPSGGQSQFSGSQSQFPAAGSAGNSSQSAPTNQYMGGQSQFQSGGSVSQGPSSTSFPPAPVVSQTQYGPGNSQFHTSYQSSSASFQPQPVSQPAQNSVYPNTQQQQQQPTASVAYPSGSASFHVRDSASAGNLSQPVGNLSQSATAVSQTSSMYSTQQPPAAPGLSKASTVQQVPSAFPTQTYSAQHSSQLSSVGGNLQASTLTNKLGESMSKMSLKEPTAMEGRAGQFEHPTSSATAASLTSTTSITSISTATSTVSAASAPVVTTSTLSSRVTSSMPITTTKAPPNLPPGVPLFNPMYLSQAASGLPPYLAAGLQGMQQPLYGGYEELQMLQGLQGRLPLPAGNFYDLAAYSGVPSSIATGRDQTAALASAPFTGAATDNKQLNRVDAQSPSQSNQQQSPHAAPQQTLPYNIHYGFFYPGAMLPGATGFQYPTMFPVPPVTNAAAPHVAGTTTGTATQMPKAYGSHQAFPSKELGWEQLIGTGGFDEVNASQDLAKVAYAGVQQQAKVAAAPTVASRMSSRSASSELSSAAFNKTHTQGFDKQGFPGGTPPPFNLPMANSSQAGLGATPAPYGTPFLPMMPPQPHNQTILHHPLQQDSSAGTGRGLQPQAHQVNQAKSAASKPYTGSWGY